MIPNKDNDLSNPNTDLEGPMAVFTYLKAASFASIQTIGLLTVGQSFRLIYHFRNFPECNKTL